MAYRKDGQRKVFIPKSYKYKCALCGVSESELLEKWAGTHFVKLTRDHIISISDGGNDYISNIQPACVSCNSSKNKRKYVNRLC